MMLDAGINFTLFVIKTNLLLIMVLCLPIVAVNTSHFGIYSHHNTLISSGKDEVNIYIKTYNRDYARARSRTWKRKSIYPFWYIIPHVI